MRCFFSFHRVWLLLFPALCVVFVSWFICWEWGCLKGKGRERKEVAVSGVPSALLAENFNLLGSAACYLAVDDGSGLALGLGEMGGCKGYVSRGMWSLLAVFERGGAF